MQQRAWAFMHAKSSPPIAVLFDSLGSPEAGVMAGETAVVETSQFQQRQIHDQFAEKNTLATLLRIVCGGRITRLPRLRIHRVGDSMWNPGGHQDHPNGKLEDCGGAVGEPRPQTVNAFPRGRPSVAHARGCGIVMLLMTWSCAGVSRCIGDYDRRATGSKDTTNTTLWKEVRPRGRTTPAWDLARESVKKLILACVHRLLYQIEPTTAADVNHSRSSERHSLTGATPACHQTPSVGEECLRVSPGVTDSSPAYSGSPKAVVNLLEKLSSRSVQQSRRHVTV